MQSGEKLLDCQHTWSEAQLLEQNLHNWLWREPGRFPEGYTPNDDKQAIQEKAFRSLIFVKLLRYF